MRMSFYLNVYLLCLIQLYCDAAKFCSKYKCERTYGNVIAGHFSGNVVLDRFLNDTDQEEFTAHNETNCVKTCVKSDPCRTISVVPDTNSTNVTCYLSQSNIYETKHVYMKDAKIISLGTSACASSPCKKGSQCQPNYETGGYSCSDIRPDVHISFDESVEPECKDKSSCLTNYEQNGRIVKVYYAKTPVLMTPKGAAGAKYTIKNMPYLSTLPLKNQISLIDLSKIKINRVYDAKTPVLMTPKGAAGAKYTIKNMPYLITPLATPRNLTLAIWFKNIGTTPQQVKVLHKGWTFAGGVSQFGNGYFFGIQNGNPLAFTAATCGTRVTVKMFNSWNHFALRLTSDVLVLAINGNTCGTLDITSMQRPSTDTRYSDVALSEEDDGVDFQFIDSLSIYNDFKSAKFVRELYEKEKGNYFIV